MTGDGYYESAVYDPGKEPNRNHGLEKCAVAVFGSQNKQRLLKTATDY